MTERPTWNETFIDIAKILSKRSKDPKTKVGAVLTKNKCIIGTGYNGEPRGFQYDFNWGTEEKYDYVIHAEMNAIANACYNGCNIKDSEIFLTHSPCNKCILQLIQFGVKKVYFIHKYKDYDFTEHIANYSNIELEQVNEYDGD